MGARERLLQPMKLQGGELVARKCLGGTIEHEHVGCLIRHRCSPDRAAKRAAFAFSRSNVLALSTTKRAWEPAPTSSSSSLTVAANVILRPSTAVTRTAISTVIPTSVGARCLIATSTPTES